MSKIKAICDKYKISHRRLGLMVKYSRSHIQRVNTGKRNMTPRFDDKLGDIIEKLENGTVKIPK